VRLKPEWIDLSLVRLLLWTFGVSYGYMRLDDYFGPNYEDLDVHLNRHELGFS